jgi:hypothetical protein
MFVRVPTGTNLFGVIDEVPGLFHVATRCHHIAYLPLFPEGSYLVFDGTEVVHDSPWWSSRTSSSVKAVPIGFRWWSWAAAWLRVACVLGVLAGLAIGTGGALFGRYGLHPVPLIAGLLVCFAGAVMSNIPAWIGRGATLAAVGFGVAMAPGTDVLVPSAVSAWPLYAAGGVIALTALWSLGRFNRASHARALELAIEAGVPVDLVERHLAAWKIQPTAPRPKLPPARVVDAASKPKPSAPPPPSPPAVAPAPAPAPVAPGEEPRLLR